MHYIPPKRVQCKRHEKNQTNLCMEFMLRLKREGRGCQTDKYGLRFGKSIAGNGTLPSPNRLRDSTIERMVKCISDYARVRRDTKLLPSQPSDE